MNCTPRSAAVALFTTLALLPAPLQAQDVLISEVRADAAGHWLELHNRTGQPVDLSNWSLHVATRTPNQPQNYWWAFPLGTVIGADQFLRVHWYQAAPTAPAAGDLWTGSTVWDFLFGLGGEPLRADRGAVGLLRSQQDDMMTTPSIVEDWVSWGDHGFQREWLAVANGRWTQGAHTASIPTGCSLARNTNALAGGTPPVDQWFVDASPTPLEPNLSGAAVTAYGPACAPFGHHLLGAPVLRAPSLPLRGNAAFGLALDHTTGIYGEFAVLVWSRAAAPAGQPSVLPFVPGGCAESIAHPALVEGWLVPTQVMSTWVPLSLANLPLELVGSELHAQALVLDVVAPNPVYQGLSNALQIVFGQ
ncbi:MAG: lamin tail domain-containing protein [Planctomycetes bacterium]|nr:lamin tail domain-containing protein [Planctomycetota bacterium]